MNKPAPSYQRHRLPSEIISHAVWLYHRFCLSFRKVEELPAERGITGTYETIRQWCQKFGLDYAHKLKKRQGRLGDIWHIDEVLVTIQEKRQYLWRAVDQEGDTIDMLVQRHRNQRATERFFRRLLKGQGHEPRWLITDKPRSYDAAHRTVMPTVKHSNDVYANNRVEVSHQPTRQQEYQMRGFASLLQAQRFLTLHGCTHNLFRLGRHLMQAVNSIAFYERRRFRFGRARCVHKEGSQVASFHPLIGKLTMPTVIFGILFGFTFVGCSGFAPRPLEVVPFEGRMQSQTQGQVTVASVALTEDESQEVFGVDLGNEGIQPVWLRIENNTPSTYWLIESSVDPDYFSPLEAAYENHVLFDDSTNHHMDNYFVQSAFNNPVGPGSTESGFVFVNLSRGRKFIHVALLSPGQVKGFEFMLRVPGLKADHLQVDFDTLYTDEEIINVEDETAFREALEHLPCCTTNEDGTENGDPLNLVIISPQGALEPQFLSRGWYETEVIYEGSIWKTVKSFLFGSRYRYSPVSPLYFLGRPQDVAVQKPRGTIDKRNHLRLWLSPFRFRGERVWLGQISRDIGVRFTTKTWSFTTHAIDPDVDEARNFLVADLLYTGGIEEIGWVGGLGVATPEQPQKNLTGDPYFHDSLRVVLLLSKDYTAMSDVRFFDWEDPSIKKARHFRQIHKRP